MSAEIVVTLTTGVGTYRDADCIACGWVTDLRCTDTVKAAAETHVRETGHRVRLTSRRTDMLAGRAS